MKSTDELASAYMSRTADYRAVFRQMWLTVNKFGDEISREDELDYVKFSKSQGVEKWNQAVLKNEVCDMAMSHDINWRQIAEVSAERGVSGEHLAELFDAVHEVALDSAMRDGLSTNCAQYLSDEEKLRVSYEESDYDRKADLYEEDDYIYADVD